jgi:tRNA modification GTPase
LVSCADEHGLEGLLGNLTALAEARMGHGGADDGDGNHPVITRQRHRGHVRECLAFMEEGQAQMGHNGDLVLAAEELRQAARCLGRIVGRIDVDELLDVIFNDFCIGK